jgi:hypothetical protein
VITFIFVLVHSPRKTVRCASPLHPSCRSLTPKPGPNDGDGIFCLCISTRSSRRCLTEGSCLRLPYLPSAPPSSSTAPRSTLPVRLSRISLSASSRASDYGDNHIFQVYLHMNFQVHTCVRRYRTARPRRRRPAPPLWWSIRGCSRGAAALRSLRARPRCGRRLERTRRINGPPSQTMLLRLCLRPIKSKGKEAWQARHFCATRYRLSPCQVS